MLENILLAIIGICITILVVSGTVFVIFLLFQVLTGAI